MIHLTDESNWEKFRASSPADIPEHLYELPTGSVRFDYFVGAVTQAVYRLDRRNGGYQWAKFKVVVR